MKNLRLLAVLFALLVAVTLHAADGAETADKAAPEKADPVWLTSLEKAQAAAKAEKKTILTNFTGSDWCGWCIKLDNEVFSTETFKTWAATHVVLLKVDFPRKSPQDDATKKANRALAEKYEIEGFPTILFLDAEGKSLGQSGYLKGGPEAWIKNAEKLVGALTETSAAPATNPNGVAMAAVTTPTTGAGNATVAVTNATGACSATAAIKAEACEGMDASACEAKIATGACSATSAIKAEACEGKDASACEAKIATGACSATSAIKAEACEGKDASACEAKIATGACSATAAIKAQACEGKDASACEAKVATGACSATAAIKGEAIAVKEAPAVEVKAATGGCCGTGN